MAIARLATAHGEWGTLDEIVSDIYDPEIRATAKTGNYSIYCNGTDNFYLDLPSSTSQHRLGFHFQHNTAAFGNPRVVSGYSGGTTVWSLRWVDEATLTLFVSGADQASLLSPTFNQTEKWHHIGVDAKIAADGWIKVYLNGEEILSYEGDTSASGTSINRLRFAGTPTVNQWFHAYYDDIYIDDTAGEPFPSPPPDKRFYLVMPEADGASSEWTPSAGTDHAALVNDVPVDTAEYVRAESAGLVDEYTLPTPPTYPDGYGISQVLLQMIAKRSNAAVQSQVLLSLGDETAAAITPGSDWSVSSVPLSGTDITLPVRLESAGDFA